MPQLCIRLSFEVGGEGIIFLFGFVVWGFCLHGCLFIYLFLKIQVLKVNF